MKWIILSFIAYISVVIFTPFVVAINIFRYGLQYLKTVAIGFDQAGGSVLYNEEDWTISSYTYYLCKHFKKYCWFEKFIDFISGKGHCEKSFHNELKLIKKEGHYELG